MLLVSRLARLFKAHGCLFERGAQVGDRFFLLGEDFARLGYVLEAGVVFVAELAELGAAKEELGE